MSDLAFYEQEYGNCTMSPIATDEDVLRNMADSRRFLEERWPDGVWTEEPHLVVSPPIGRRRVRGWYGRFAPQGIVTVPAAVEV